jgi:hypothetical protein
MGVIGVASLASFNRIASRFFSSVRRKTLIVVRNDLFGLQSSAATGECSQTGHVEGSVDWPTRGIRRCGGSFLHLHVLTGFTYRLVAAWKTESVDRETTADSASKLDWDLLLREGAL